MLFENRKNKIVGSTRFSMKLMIFDRFFDHFSIIKNRHAGMRIEFWMSDMASGNPNWISGHVTEDTQGMDQKRRIFSIKIRDFPSFFDQKNRHAGM